MVDADLARMFTNCYPNTLDTTVNQHEIVDGEPDTYIITGDIDAMWLRDSTNQVAPYVRLIPNDPALERMVCGVIRRQARYVLHDPYANAFNENDEGTCHRRLQL